MSQAEIIQSSCHQVKDLSQADLVTTNEEVLYYARHDDSGSISGFWDSYCFAVSEKQRFDNIHLFIAEKVPELTPLQITLNMLFKKKSLDESEDGSNEEFFDDEKPYANTFVLKFIKAIQDVIKDNYQISSNKEELTCFVLEQDDFATNRNGEEFVQIKFCFPNCIINKEDIYNLFCKQIEKKILTRNINKNLLLTPVYSWAETLRENKKNDYWHLYGSKATEEDQDLFLTYIIDEVTEDYDEEEEIPDHEIPEAEIGDFLPDNHTDAINGFVTQDLIESAETLEHWLPMILSVKYRQIPTKKRVNKPKDKKKRSFTTTRIPPLNSSEETIAKFFMTLISKEKFTNRQYWQKIGAALYNTFEDSNVAFNVWKEHTLKCGKFTQLDMNAVFPSFEANNSYDFKTLGWFAKEDNPEVFGRWQDAWVDEAFDKACIKKNDLSIAEVFYRKYWFEFGCERYRPLSLYYYQNHRWRETDSGDKILIRIIRGFSHFIDDKVIAMVQERRDLPEGEEKDKLQKKISGANNISEKIGRESVMQKVSKILSLLYKRDNFAEFKDMNEKLTCFLNGVLEVCGKSSVFRPGIPEDYVTLSCSCKFDETLTEESKSVQMVQSMFDQIYHHTDLSDFMFRVYAYTGFLSFNFLRKIFSHIGPTGANGKSTIKKLIEKVWGKYVFTTSASAFAESPNGNSGSASPHFVLGRYCRFFFAQESNREQIWSDSRLKEASGDDLVYGRLMRENGCVYRQHFTIHTINNHAQIIHGADLPIRERMVFIPYNTRYVEDAPKSKKQQRKQRLYPRDDNLDSKLSELAPAMAWLCREHLHDFLKHGLQIPERIKAFSRDHWRQNDPFDMFINEHVEQATTFDPTGVEIKDENAHVDTRRMYRDFKNFFDEYFENVNMPSYNNVITEFNNRLGTHRNGRWNGWTFTQQDDYN